MTTILKMVPEKRFSTMPPHMKKQRLFLFGLLFDDALPRKFKKKKNIEIEHVNFQKVSLTI